MKGKLFPLHVHIATLFIGLTLVFGLALGWFNYQHNTQIILAASAQAFEQINQELMSDLHGKHVQTAGSLNLLVHTDLVRADSLSHRLRNLELFTTALHDNPSLSALQVGYANGDYFIVRPLNDEYMRQQFQAPAEAVYVVENIQGGKAPHPMQRLYVDADLKEIGRKTLPPSHYDPRKRDWYRLAMAAEGVVETKPYLYYFIRKPGITLGRKSFDGKAVVAADITLESLSDIVARHPVSPSAQIVVVDGMRRVIAWPDPTRLVLKLKGDTVQLARLGQLGSEVLSQVAPQFSGGDDDLAFEHDGRQWLGTIRQVAVLDGLPLYLLIVAPRDEVLADAYRINRRNALITLIIFLLTLPAVWLVAHRITQSLRVLAAETEVIRDLDFRQAVPVNSRIREIVDLAQGMNLMKETINKFLRLVGSLSAEQDFDRMLRLICRETLDASQAAGAAIFMLDEDERYLVPAIWQVGEESLPSLQETKIPLDGDSVLAAAQGNEKVHMVTVDEKEADLPVQIMLRDLQCSQAQMGVYPLLSRRGHSAGLLCLIYPQRQQQTSCPRMGFLEKLSGFAAVSLETRKLFKSQKDLLQAFIQLIAGAIDAKSPYTGGHCQRVPELTRMLAEAASNSNEGSFSAFNPLPEDWEAIHIASWLHDCGKITTPEYVVDKSTKLETIYNRIHEIRTRFEVLKRDAEIRCWQAIAQGEERYPCLQQLQKELAELDDDYAFVARCNQGGEFLSNDDRNRLETIGRRTWSRTIDDRIGLSREELQYKESVDTGLPAEEYLLADRPEHRIPGDRRNLVAEGNPWGFHMAVPACKFDLGEMHNLSVKKGTLTEEERYIINEHIIQTIIMLEKLPWPRHLRKVPEIAGGHHEKMDGSGYPRRLAREELSLEARIMAIADIFEALTASDRPYKAPKKLSEAIEIMYHMKQDQHIDAELFDLFLASGVYRQYAERHLSAEQLDEVNIEQYLS